MRGQSINFNSAFFPEDCKDWLSDSPTSESTITPRPYILSQCKSHPVNASWDSNHSLCGSLHRDARDNTLHVINPAYKEVRFSLTEAQSAKIESHSVSSENLSSFRKNSLHPLDVDARDLSMPTSVPIPTRRHSSILTSCMRTALHGIEHEDEECFGNGSSESQSLAHLPSGDCRLVDAYPYGPPSWGCQQSSGATPPSNVAARGVLYPDNIKQQHASHDPLAYLQWTADDGATCCFKEEVHLHPCEHQLPPQRNHHKLATKPLHCRPGPDNAAQDFSALHGQPLSPSDAVGAASINHTKMQPRIDGFRPECDPEDDTLNNLLGYSHYHHSNIHSSCTLAMAPLPLTRAYPVSIKCQPSPTEDHLASTPIQASRLNDVQPAQHSTPDSDLSAIHTFVGDTLYTDENLSHDSTISRICPNQCVTPCIHSPATFECQPLWGMTSLQQDQTPCSDLSSIHQMITGTPQCPSSLSESLSHSRSSSPCTSSDEYLTAGSDCSSTSDDHSVSTSHDSGESDYLSTPGTAISNGPPPRSPARRGRSRLRRQVYQAAVDVESPASVSPEARQQHVFAGRILVTPRLHNGKLPGDMQTPPCHAQSEPICRPPLSPIFPAEQKCLGLVAKREYPQRSHRSYLGEDSSFHTQFDTSPSDGLIARLQKVGYNLEPDETDQHQANPGHTAASHTPDSFHCERQPDTWLNFESSSIDKTANGQSDSSTYFPETMSSCTRSKYTPRHGARDNWSKVTLQRSPSRNQSPEFYTRLRGYNDQLTNLNLRDLGSGVNTTSISQRSDHSFQHLEDGFWEWYKLVDPIQEQGDTVGDAVQALETGGTSPAGQTHGSDVTTF